MVLVDDGRGPETVQRRKWPCRREGLQMGCRQGGRSPKAESTKELEEAPVVAMSETPKAQTLIKFRDAEIPVIDFTAPPPATFT